MLVLHLPARVVAVPVGGADQQQLPVAGVSVILHPGALAEAAEALAYLV
jgi:hypothetical protein